MFCPKCGTQLNDGAAFCNVCGANLQAAAPAPAPAPNPYATPNPYVNPNPYVRPVAPSHLLTGKSVSVKDSNFIFIVIAAIFAFFATVLMHCPVLSSGVGSYSAELTLMMAGFANTGTLNAIGQIIFTILTFISLVYLFLPYIPGVPLKMNLFNYVAPIAILFFQMILFVVGGLTHGQTNVSLSMDGWLFWLSTIVSIGLLTFELIKFAIKK